VHALSTAQCASPGVPVVDGHMYMHVQTWPCEVAVERVLW